MPVRVISFDALLGEAEKIESIREKRKKTCDDFWRTFGKAYECTPTPTSK